MFNKTMYTWNIAYNFIMKIKHAYVARFGKDTVNLADMINKLNVKEYTSFKNCVKLTQKGNFVLVKYSLVGKETPDLYENPNSIYREMRSLVVDMQEEAIVCCPFRKFFNIDETPEFAMDVVVDKIKNAKCVEISNKLDGSMQQARYYNGEIVYTGASAMDPSQSEQLEQGLAIFNANNNYSKMVKGNPDYTFVFEYTSPNNLIVVQYTEDKLSLIGVRNVYTGEQLSYADMIKFAEEYNLPHTEVETKSFDKLMEEAKQYTAIEKEGWVLYVDGEQFKLKCDDYRAVHRILSFVSAPKVIIKAIADDYFDDVIAKVPSAYRDGVNKVAKVVYDYVHDMEMNIDKYYQQIADITDRKEMAMYITNNVPKKYQPYMFMKKDGFPYHVLKKHINTDQPSYIKLSEIIGTSNYRKFFDTIGMKDLSEDAE